MEIILYQFEQCPFCVKVRKKLNDLNLNYKIVNVDYSRDDPLRKTLLKETGVASVPIIKLGDKFIGDSKKIINYLNQNF